MTPVPAGHVLLPVISGCRQMSSSERNLCWYQPGVPGITQQPDAIVSAALLVGRGCTSAPSPVPGKMSPISAYRASPRQTSRSNRLSRSGSETGAVPLSTSTAGSKMHIYDLPPATHCWQELARRAVSGQHFQSTGGSHASRSRAVLLHCPATFCVLTL